MTQEKSEFDIVVIGAGIAGASVAAELSSNARVLLLEREPQPGYHTTGRSAAIYSQTYGPPAIRALTRASGAFFGAPPDGFCNAPLLTPRRVIMVARQDQRAALDALLSQLTSDDDFELLGRVQLEQIVPILRPGYADAGMLDNNAMDIDVHGLHHGYLNVFKRNSGTIWTNVGVSKLERVAGVWEVEFGGGIVRAPIVVNAAGAWADELGQLAGAQPVGLQPRRRTALIIEAPNNSAMDDLPLIADIDEQFYLKPDAGRLLISPADETLSAPCDAQPEELDIAICIDRIETAFDLSVKRIINKWAGLRCFVEDGNPVVGYDRKTPGFFWLAAQGGYGIQSAPALARLSAALVLDHDVPADIVAHGLEIEEILASRQALVKNQISAAD